MSTFDPTAKRAAPAERLGAAAVLNVLMANPLQESIILADLLSWGQRGLFPKHREGTKKVPPTWDASEIAAWLEKTFKDSPAELAPTKAALAVHVHRLRSFTV